MKYSLKEIEMLKNDRNKCIRRVNRLITKAPVKLLNAYQDLIHELNGELIEIAIAKDLYEKISIEELRTCKK